jgi:hypothetical protein
MTASSTLDAGALSVGGTPLSAMVENTVSSDGEEQIDPLVVDGRCTYEE